MANNDTKNKISIATYGVGTRLDDESNKMSDIVRQTTLEVANKFGKRFDNKVIDSYTNLNLSNLFVATEKKSAKKAENEVNKFKEMMQDNSANAIQMLTAEQGRVLNYANYKSIVDNIPECALALDTYISNILSPDDYSKNIFTIEYDSSDKAVEEKVNNELKALVKKYKIEDKTEEIVSNTLTYGDCFVSVLPYDREIAKFLAQTSDTNLNESEGYDILDETYHITERTHMNVLTEEMVSESFTQEEISVLSEAIGEKDTVSIFLNAVNNNIKIKSVTDLLKSKAMADNDIIFSKSDIEIGKDKQNKPKDPKAMAINGAAIKILEPERVVSLDIGGVCYGYYYVEPGYGAGAETPYNANNAKMYAQTSNPMNPSLQPQPTGDTPGEGAANPIAKNLNVSDEKLQLLSQVLLKAISKKLNKEYVSDNKQFKDLLYNLLKQKYIFEKGISITYFMPEEVVHFAANSIFEKIVFFAKIYLAVLTNTVIIKMGRGHDKRVFYVNAGPDNNHEQAIMQVIQDVKTKEFKMSNLGSISSILSLNPGIFDDMYLPIVNGEKPVDIDVIAGMDQDINNEFTEFLKKSMIQGTGLPPALLEAADNIEFAKQISAQNANFCRRIVRYQKLLTNPFEELIRMLYKFEHQYNLDGSDQIDDININDITIKFPSPGSLNLTNLIDLFTQFDTVSDYITKRFVPDKMDQSNVDEQAAFKMEVMEKVLPQIEWDEYKELYEAFKDKFDEKQLIQKANMPPIDPNDPYGGQQY